MFLVRIFFLVSTSIYVYSQDDNSASDILFLKIQELEIEIAELRNQVESQNHLIEKLLQESSKESDKGSNIIKDISADNAIRF